MKRELPGLAGAIAVFILFMVVAPAFRSWEALATVLYASSTIGIMAIAVGLLMIGGEFDLSAGVAVTTAALSASMFSYYLHLNVWVGALLALALAIGIGVFNGILVTRKHISSFLITLASFLMLQGANLAVTKAITNQVATRPISDMAGFSAARAVFASSISIVGVNVRITVLWWVLFVILGAVVLTKTQLGNWIFAVGGNEQAARDSGVPTWRVKVFLFMIVGFAAWFVGMHTLFQFDSIQAGQGVGNEFLYIIAAVIGGVNMNGGRGSVVGTMIGALIFGMVNQGIVYAGWNPDWFKFFLGVMLLGAVLMNTSVERRTSELH
ncbi:MAG: ABC transporter permease [Corynebacterium sp.]|nr:ABC transporter permease [Corynebacterium sp.]